MVHFKKSRRRGGGRVYVREAGECNLKKLVQKKSGDQFFLRLRGSSAERMEKPKSKGSENRVRRSCKTKRRSPKGPAGEKTF